MARPGDGGIRRMDRLNWLPRPNQFLRRGHQAPAEPSRQIGRLGSPEDGPHQKLRPVVRAPFFSTGRGAESHLFQAALPLVFIASSAKRPVSSAM